MSAGESLGGGPEKSPCVLVVEDDPMQRRVVVRLAKAWGYDVIEAEDGRAAVVRFEDARERIGVILLDIMLPVLDGVSVARHVRGRDAQMPIVACSAALSDQVVDNLRGLGVRNILSKPYDAASLKSNLASALHRNGDG